MEIKKSEKANLENKKGLFTLIGYALTLILVYVAFEWKSSGEVASVFEEETTVEIEIEETPITTEAPPPVPEAPKVPILSDEIAIVDDDIEVEDDLFVSLEDSNDLGVEFRDYVEEVYEEEIIEEAIPFALVEEKPSFNGGGPSEFSKWVNKNLVYPTSAAENGIQGVVTLHFTVDKTGQVKNVRVLRGVDSSIDKEAVRVVQSSPKWVPGKQRDRAVAVNYTFPVRFVLR